MNNFSNTSQAINTLANNSLQKGLTLSKTLSDFKNNDQNITICSDILKTIENQENNSIKIPYTILNDQKYRIVCSLCQNEPLNQSNDLDFIIINIDSVDFDNDQNLREMIFRLGIDQITRDNQANSQQNTLFLECFLKLFKNDSLSSNESYLIKLDKLLFVLTNKCFENVGKALQIMIEKPLQAVVDKPLQHIDKGTQAIMDKFLQHMMSKPSQLKVDKPLTNTEIPSQDMNKHWSRMMDKISQSMHGPLQGTENSFEMMNKPSQSNPNLNSSPLITYELVKRTLESILNKSILSSTSRFSFESTTSKENIIDTTTTTATTATADYNPLLDKTEDKSPSKPITFTSPVNKTIILRIIEDQKNPIQLIETPTEASKALPSEFVKSNQSVLKIINIESQYNISACGHLSYLLKEFESSAKNYPLKFKILCSECQVSSTNYTIFKNLLFRLATLNNPAFKSRVLKQAMLESWRDRRQFFQNDPDVALFSSKFCDLVSKTRKQSDPELFRNLMWAMKNINMDLIIDEFKVKLKPEYEPNYSISNPNPTKILEIFDSLRNLSHLISKLEADQNSLGKIKHIITTTNTASMSQGCHLNPLSGISSSSNHYEKLSKFPEASKKIQLISNNYTPGESNILKGESKILRDESKPLKPVPKLLKIVDLAQKKIVLSENNSPRYEESTIIPEHIILKQQQQQQQHSNDPKFQRKITISETNSPKSNEQQQQQIINNGTKKMKNEPISLNLMKLISPKDSNINDNGNKPYFSARAYEHSDGQKKIKITEIENETMMATKEISLTNPNEIPISDTNQKQI